MVTETTPRTAAASTPVKWLIRGAVALLVILGVIYFLPAKSPPPPPPPPPAKLVVAMDWIKGE